MTINILFISEKETVVCANMCSSNLGGVILEELTQEEYDKWGPFFDDDRTFTDKEFIEKVLDACIKHDYIPEDFYVLGRFVDTLKIEL